MSEMTPPSPGAWSLDESHMPVPSSRWLGEAMPAAYTRGFREAFAANGALLDRIEGAFVEGWFYYCVRPVGAPPAAKGPPPKLIFKLLLRLHPELRRRARRCAEVFATKHWREEARQFREVWRPEVLARNAALQVVDVTTLPDAELARHLGDCRAAFERVTYLHHRVVCAASLPVGDFLAQTRAWTRRPAHELLGLLRGASRSSLWSLEALEGLCRALRASPEGLASLRGGHDDEDTLARLRGAPGAVGEAATRWLDLVGPRIVSGFDVAGLRGCESPSLLLRTLRAHLGASPDEAAAAAQTARLRQEVRAEVPEAERARFDELLDEARHCYGIRDERNDGFEDWCLGLARRALLEAGRRLVAAGRLKDAEHAVELTDPEVRSLLAGGAGPSAEDCEAAWARRLRAKPGDAPAHLGLPPAAPPPPEWLPPAMARMARAMDEYVNGMFRDTEAASDRTVVRGLAASPGKRAGTARLVLDREDFARVEPGDILVARMTSPAYNVLLPLLAGVVTDRGGALSHPAIVSREFGIPGVVGTRVASTLIPDGARVEIDGTAGTVTVLG